MHEAGTGWRRGRREVRSEKLWGGEGLRKRGGAEGRARGDTHGKKGSVGEGEGKTSAGKGRSRDAVNRAKNKRVEQIGKKRVWMKERK